MSLSDWNIAKSIVRIDIPKLILWRKINSSPKEAFIKTISGSIVSTRDAVSGAPKELVVNVNADEESEGYSETNIFVSGRNVWGGSTMLNDVSSKMPNCIVDEDEEGRYVRFTSIQANGKEFFTRFKPDTTYTFIMAVKKTNTSYPINMKINYADGGFKNLNRSGNEIDTLDYCVFTSPSGRSISQLIGLNQSGTTYLYCDKSGIFEGTVSLEEFEAYKERKTTISWESEAGLIKNGSVNIAEDGTTELMVVSDGATEKHDLDSTVINLNSGDNTIWADTGSVELTYAGRSSD